MDLASYLRSIRRYLVVVLLATVVVGAVTAFVVARSTTGSYEATLRVSLPVANGQARELDQTTADYIGELTSPATLATASQASGLSTDSLDGALSGERLTQSGSQIQITGTAANPTGLARAVTVAAQAAYANLMRPRLEAAQTRQAKLSDAYQQVKNTPVPTQPDANQQRLQSQAEFAALRAVTDAGSEVLNIQVQTQVFDDAANVNAVSVAPVKPTKQIVQATLTNAGGTLFALVALLVAVELWRGRPSRSEVTGSSSDGDPAAATGVGPAEEADAAATEDPKGARVPSAATSKEAQELATARAD